MTVSLVGVCDFGMRRSAYEMAVPSPRRENLALLPCKGKGASFPVFTFCPDSATISAMFKLNVVFEFMAELVRTLLVSESAERVRTKARSLRARRRLRGMKQVRRHIHRQCRRRLFDKLST